MPSSLRLTCAHATLVAAVLIVLCPAGQGARPPLSVRQVEHHSASRADRINERDDALASGRSHCYGRTECTSWRQDVPEAWLLENGTDLKSPCRYGQVASYGVKCTSDCYGVTEYECECLSPEAARHGNNNNNKHIILGVLLIWCCFGIGTLCGKVIACALKKLISRCRATSVSPCDVVSTPPPNPGASPVERSGIPVIPESQQTGQQPNICRPRDEKHSSTCKAVCNFLQMQFYTAVVS